MRINKLKPSGKQPFTLHHFAILLGQFSSGNFKLRCEIYQPHPADDISNIVQNILPQQSHWECRE